MAGGLGVPVDDEADLPLPLGLWCRCWIARVRVCSRANAYLMASKQERMKKVLGPTVYFRGTLQ